LWSDCARHRLLFQTAHRRSFHHPDTHLHHREYHDHTHHILPSVGLHPSTDGPLPWGGGHLLKMACSKMAIYLRGIPRRSGQRTWRNAILMSLTRPPRRGWNAIRVESGLTLSHPAYRKRMDQPFLREYPSGLQKRLPGWTYIMADTTLYSEEGTPSGAGHRPRATAKAASRGAVFERPTALASCVQV
jgi:hypothetical protein